MFHYAYTLRHVFTSLTEYKEYRPEPLRSYFYEHLVPVLIFSFKSTMCCMLEPYFPAASVTCHPSLVLSHQTFLDRHRRVQLSSLQFSHTVVSDSLQPHGLQHARPPCPSPTPRVYPNSVHRVSDAIQPSYPLLSPSPPAFNPSQPQGLFK